MEYHLTFTPTLDDYKRASRFVQSRLLGKGRWVHLVASLVLGAILFLPIGFLGVLADKFAPLEMHNYVLMAKIGILVGLVIMAVHLKSLNSYIQRRSYVPNGYMLETREVTANERAIVFSGQLSTGTLEWKRAHALAECSSNFYFFVDPGMAFFLPKRSFSDASQMEGFRAAVKAWHARS